jgi:hypothetical protein
LPVTLKTGDIIKGKTMKTKILYNYDRQMSKLPFRLSAEQKDLYYMWLIKLNVEIEI